MCQCGGEVTFALTSRLEQMNPKTAKTAGVLVYAHDSRQKGRLLASDEQVDHMVTEGLFERSNGSLVFVGPVPGLRGYPIEYAQKVGQAEMTVPYAIAAFLDNRRIACPGECLIPEGWTLKDAEPQTAVWPSCLEPVG